MICPKCEVGELKKIQFKKSLKIAFLCDYCESLWFEEEHINSHTGHALSSFSQGEDLEYTYE